jgi:hypothetical protein
MSNAGKGKCGAAMVCPFLAKSANCFKRVSTAFSGLYRIQLPFQVYQIAQYVNVRYLQ